MSGEDELSLSERVASASRKLSQRAAQTQDLPVTQGNDRTALQLKMRGIFDALTAERQRIHNAGEHIWFLRDQGGAGAFLNLDAIIADIQHIKSLLDAAMPHSICTFCGGNGCRACRMEGWLPKMQSNAAPQLKKKGEQSK